MPVTPKFQLSQSDEFVVLTVHVPYIRVSDLEYRIDGAVLSFYVKPYLLRLNFPHDLVDDDRAKAVYDPNTRNGTLTLHLPKAVKGQHFDDLDLLTRLKQPKRSAAPAQPLIQVVSSTEFEEEGAPPRPSLYVKCLAEYVNVDSRGRKDTGLGRSKEKKYSDALLEMEEVIAGNVSQVGEIAVSMEGEEEIDVLGRSVRYGFNNRFEGFFKDVKDEFPELVQLEEPDKTPQEERRGLRKVAEDRDFNAERFVADLFAAEEDWLFEAFFQFEPFWLKQDETASVLTEEEQDQLMSLDNVEILPLDGKERTMALCCIYDIVLANAYDYRMTKGEGSVESAWTVRTLSATLSWLEEWNRPAEVLESIIHRSLVYPYIRHTDLTTQIVSDATKVFECGKRAVLKCLLRVRSVFAHSDTFYLLNRLFLNDMALWIQGVPDEEIESFTEIVKQAGSTSNVEETVRWNIPEIVENVLAEREGDEEQEEGAGEESSGESSEEEDSESDEDDVDDEHDEDGDSSAKSDDTEEEEQAEEEETSDSEVDTKTEAANLLNDDTCPGGDGASKGAKIVVIS